MKLNDYSVTELNKNDLIKIEGGSWLSRRWDEIKAFLSDLGEEILEGIAGGTMSGPGGSGPIFPQN